MHRNLPEYIDPLFLVDKGRQFNGILALSNMSRLKDVLFAKPDGPETIAIDLIFNRTDKIASVTGTIKANLMLKCQVCLKPMDFCIDKFIKLGVVFSLDEANLLPESHDPLILSEEKIAFHEIVEDEILLELPIIPQHNNCISGYREHKKPIKSANNPFSGLADLKKTGVYNGSTEESQITRKTGHPTRPRWIKS